MPTSTSIIRKKEQEPNSVPPQRDDEDDAGGHMPSPTSDDSVDALVEEMQLYQDNEDGTQELDIAGQVNQAERSRHFDD